MKTTIRVIGDVLEVAAVPTAAPGLLATFRDQEDGAEDLRWSLTHRRSGLSVVPLRFASQEDALEAADVLSEIDFSRHSRELGSDARLMELLRFLWQFYPANRLEHAIKAIDEEQRDLAEEGRVS